jgi:hypothetical protein
MPPLRRTCSSRAARPAGPRRSEGCADPPDEAAPKVVAISSIAGDGHKVRAALSGMCSMDIEPASSAAG